MNTQKEKSGVQKMRERYEKIKENIRPSKELLEIFSKEEKSHTENRNEEKVARSYTPETGV